MFRRPKSRGMGPKVNFTSDICSANLAIAARLVELVAVTRSYRWTFMSF